MLPDLPAIIGQWDTSCGLVVPDPANWVQLLPGDPCRWFFSMFSPAAAQPLFAPFTDPGMVNGYIAPGDRPIDFEYTKYGPIIQQQWMVTGRGSLQPFILAVAAIRLRPLPATDRQQWLRSLGKLSPEMRMFVKHAIDQIDTNQSEDKYVLARHTNQPAHDQYRADDNRGRELSRQS